MREIVLYFWQFEAGPSPLTSKWAEESPDIETSFGTISCARLHIKRRAETYPAGVTPTFEPTDDKKEEGEMSLDFVSDQLTDAVLLMLESSDSIQTRLLYAALSTHALARPEKLGTELLPTQIKHRFTLWWDQVTTSADIQEESLDSIKIPNISDQAAARLARELFEIYREVEVRYVESLFCKSFKSNA